MEGSTIKKKKAAKPKRQYSTKTIKILFAMSRNQCAHPDCTQPVIEPKTKVSDALVVGQIAHIYALSDDGPRGCKTMTEKERNMPDNLMLFCPTHHVVVDGQHQTYPAVLLLKWKARHEWPYQEALSGAISDIGYAELEVSATALMSSSNSFADGSLTRIPPQEKIDRNGLGTTSAMFLTMGAAKSREVEQVIIQAAQLDAGFPDRLRQGFVAQYLKLVAEGLEGDDLFVAMYAWAGGTRGDKRREAAGLCILSHLFIICDVFKK